jgi:hypothetical protein
MRVGTGVDWATRGGEEEAEEVTEEIELGEAEGKETEVG